MLSRSAFFRRILSTPAAREFLLKSLAVGEADSAEDLDRVAEPVPDPLLARRIYRHFAEERRHARLFRRHLEAQGFRATPLPPELDCERHAQRYGMGTPRARLEDPAPFTDEDPILFFAGSTAGEERACVEMEGLIRGLALRCFAGLAIEAGFLWRWLFPGGLDAPRLADPMPVPGEATS